MSENKKIVEEKSMGNDKEHNPGHTHPEYVPMALCAESRAHMETKIDNMETKIVNAINASIKTVKIVVLVAGFVLACLQLGIHLWG